MIHDILKKYKLDTYGITNIIDFSFLKENFDFMKFNNHLVSFDENDFEKRRSPEKLFSGLKSIISIAFPYNTDEELPFNHEYTISKYALRNDYHKVIKTILNAVCDELSSIYPTHNFKHFADSNPMFEKEIAVICKIGFTGKNSLLYTKKYGSYVFLAEILTDLILEPFTSIEYNNPNICSSCGLCSKNCPNNAISDFFSPSKCISYFTAVKGDIHEDNIKNNLWGCDICQDVCPLNKNISYSPIEEFKLNPELYLPLEEIVSLSNKKLVKFYSDSPIGWSGANVVRRNAELLLKRKKLKTE